MSAAVSGNQVASYPQVGRLQHNQWYTFIGRRVGSVYSAELWTQDLTQLVGKASINLPSIEDYKYFHLSTQDSMHNYDHSYFKVDNVQLTTGVESSAPLPSIAWGALALLGFTGLRTRCGRHRKV